MEARTIAIVGNVNFIEAGNLIIASPFEIDDAGMFGPEVAKAAKSAGLPASGWRKSEYTDSFVMEVK